MAIPPVYPSNLVGLSFSVIKRPKWSNGRGVAASGRDVRIAYWSAPIWEWELTYDYLPDEVPFSDLKTLIGFYLQVSGSFGGFLFADPDDFTVTGQGIGIGDGVNTSIPITRIYGIPNGSGTEPIGYLATSVPFNVYLNGVLQTSGYTVDQSQPGNQRVNFASAPAAGVAITVDMTYYYYVHFKDDTQDFEKFMNQLWLNKKVTLESLRG